tara:strand:- start:204 stop:572 length:369 start_codon:yes stop_codon:yes gene_type:complete
MATLTGQLKLDISGITSDVISIDESFTFTATSGGVTSRSIDTTATSGEKVIEADEYAAGDIVYLRNRSTGTDIITIRLGADVDGEFELKAGQFAIFPWAKNADVLAYTSANAPVLEIGTFAA